MGTPSCETLANNAVSCPHNLADPSDPGSCGILLPAPKRLQKKPDPVRPNPHRKALQRTASPRSRTPHYEQPCSRQPSRAFADPRGDAGHMAQRDAFNAKTRRIEGQARAGPAASTGCAVFAKAGFLCDNKRHPFEDISRPVGAAGAQVPYKHKVTGSNPVPATIKIAGQTLFSSDLFFSGKSRASKCPTNSRQSATQAFRQYAVPIKMDADLRRRPDENPPYAPLARFLHASPKRPPAQPRLIGQNVCPH